MTGTILFDILGVVIGIVFIYLLFSIMTSWIQEFIASIRGFRSKDLASIFQNMLDPSAKKLDGVKKLEEIWAEGVNVSVATQLSENAVKALYEHQIFKSLSKPGKLPSYVSSRDFSLVLFDLLSKAGTDDPTQAEITLENIKAGIENIKNDALKERLLYLVTSAGVVEDKIEDQLVAFRNNVYHWFDSSMDRASGWYKRKAQILAIIIGIVVAVLFNADTISISQSLWQDSALRESIGRAAENLIIEGESAKAKEAQNLLGELGFPLGWSLHFPDTETAQDSRDFPNTLGGWIVKALGLFITGIAISQGSSLWFDVLGRLVNLRGTGGKPENDAESVGESPSVRLEIDSSSLKLPSQSTRGAES